jgi:hypothetical protein
LAENGVDLSEGISAQDGAFLMMPLMVLLPLLTTDRLFISS